MSLYGQVLVELVLAFGAALFFGNAYALYRRRTDERQAAERTVARGRPGSPVRPYRRDDEPRDLTRAPLARTIMYMVIGFVVMVWGVATIASG
ncbi:MAG: hypothetical protein ACT4OX_08935 [Actinomycetota bacterium]